MHHLAFLVSGALKPAALLMSTFSLPFSTAMIVILVNKMNQ